MMTAESPTLTQPSSDTPILDRIVPVTLPAHSNGKSQLAGVVLGAVIGVGIVFFSVTAELGFLPGLARPFFHHLAGLRAVGFLAVAVLCLYPGIAIHEMGHLIFGLLAGLRFNMVSFGPLVIN